MPFIVHLDLLEFLSSITMFSVIAILNYLENYAVKNTIKNILKLVNYTEHVAFFGTHVGLPILRT